MTGFQIPSLPCTSKHNELSRTESPRHDAHGKAQRRKGGGASGQGEVEACGGGEGGGGCHHNPDRRSDIVDALNLQNWLL
ncbi:hypothetical protein F511_30937 [Dorcoceras hygrometricum]|uniref:Uncharacterized protein n=1 Tax=Dorcoceras hygrometricum TaxID=472368 RepID=A0A2Z7AFW0_9LAMI|nr:hypothetical protein F511_30937 [Dorcoceras hygrometricum]